MLQQATNPQTTPGLDQPAYTVLRRAREYEVRRYEPYAVAEVGMPASAAPASGAASCRARCGASGSGLQARARRTTATGVGCWCWDADGVCLWSLYEQTVTCLP